ncbi:MAG: HEAT repeat domain-containing protein, partial [Anaerolineae bacterium]
MEHPSLSPETTDLAAGRQRDILHAVLDAPTLDALAGLAQQAHAQQIAGELADTIIKTLKPGLAVFGFGGLFGERFTPAQRANALHMIRLLAEPVQLEPLIRCLFDRSADVRYAAAWALSSMAMWLEWGTPEIQQAIRALIGAARHREDREVRLMAVKTLGRISAWEAKDALVQRLDDEQDDEIRTEVALALGRLKHADAVYDLMSAYEAGEIDAQVCMTAVLRLDNDAIEPLISVLSRWNVRLVSRILAADA